MSTLAEIFVAVRPDTSGTEPELNRKLSAVDARPGATTAGRKAGHHFGAAMLGIVKASAVTIGAALAGGGVLAGKFLKDAIGSASDLNETASKISVIFGKSTADLNRWAAVAANGMGQTKQEALDAAATFGVFGKQAGFTGTKLAGFSTKLVSTASDMASFSNTTPTDAIDAIGAALRGEFDPIERYGVLLNESNIKQKALALGLIDTTKNALTPQQRVIAVQAELYEQLGKKGSGALGDFARTSGGLANQQRILTANVGNLRTEIGAGLLPVTTRFVSALNSQVIPALRETWQKHGPAITAFLVRMGDRLVDVTVALTKVDWATKFDQAKAAVARFRTEMGPTLEQFTTKVGPAGESLRTKLLPALKELQTSGGEQLADGLRVTAVVMGFLADHVDLLAKALPILAGGLVLYKVAQLGANIAAAASPVIRIAEIVAINRHSAALAANTVANATNRTVTVGATAAVAASTVAENAGFFARARSTVAMIAQRVAMIAVRTATIAWTAVQWLLNAALTANPIGLVVVAIGLLVAAVIYAYKHNETFRKIVQAVWAAVKVAIKAVSDWFVNIIIPSIRVAIEQGNTAWKALRAVVSAAWNGIRDGIGAGWAFIRDKVFNPVRTFITQTIPNAFKSGVTAIGKAWEGLRELAARPVRFVVDTVINSGIIGTFNKVSGFFGGPKVSPVALPRGLGDGPGMPARSAGRRMGDGLGDGIGDVLGFLRGPANWIKSRVSGKLDAIGTNPFAQMLKGMGGKLVGGLIDKAKSLLKGSEFAGSSSGVGGLQAGISGVLGTLRQLFGNVRLISGFRPGAHTLSGNVSYHASGRAIDIPPVYEWASFLNAAYGGRLRELITPWNDLNILNGRAHRYAGAIWNQHNFAGGNAHIHAAMFGGGVINEPVFGVGRSGRTYSFGEYGPETVTPGRPGGGNTYNINVTVAVGTHPAEIGRQIVQHITAFESSNGTGWRKQP